LLVSRHAETEPAASSALIRHRWLAGTGLLLAALGTVCAETPAPCVIAAAAGMQIEVRSEPDDGVWGPTLEVVVQGELGPLNRLMAPETRPIEACWWVDIDADGKPELVVGLGADSERRQSSGVLIYAWDGHVLHPTTVPALPAAAAADYRYVVRQGAVWAYPLPPDERVAAPRYRLLAGGRWEAVPP